MRNKIDTKIRNKLVFKPFIMGSNRPIYSFLNKVRGIGAKLLINTETIA
jgi:hypothetical protein